MGERPEFKGDYMGFTYNGKHSSELGIVRVSDGSRFNENLLPTMQDKTVQVPGGDGMYFFGSYYTQRQFNVNFAFDSLSEVQVAELKRHFSDKQIHDLIFDETPYKVWSAKVTGTATLKYIPFGEGETGRTYKGEGTIQFTCYQPYARVKSKNPHNYVVYTHWENPETELITQYFYNKKTKKFESSIEQVDQGSRYCSEIGSFNEWQAASGIIELPDGGGAVEQFDEFVDVGGTSNMWCGLYNPGDKPSDFLLVCFGIQSNGSISVSVNDTLSSSLSWKGLELKGEDDGVLFNSKNGLLQGFQGQVDDYKTTSNIYNEYITEGTFFQIPVSREEDINKAPRFLFENENGRELPILKYDYYYL